MENQKINSEFYIFSDDDTNDPNYIIIIRDLNFIKDKDINKNKKILEPKEEKKNWNLTIVFYLENFSQTLNASKFRDIIILFKDNKNLNLVIKNCFLKKDDNDCQFYFEDEDLKFNILYISDELYSISPYLDNYFKRIKSEKLILKHFKINSNEQLNDFLNFIINSGCKELELEDIYIELIIKKDENDESYKISEQYITFENGKFYIINFKDEKPKELNITKLKMKDCPLFGLSQNIFIIKDKNISIDIDENSLLETDIITKFKIYEEYCEICFDLDSFKLNEDKDEDYLKYLEYIFNIIIYNKDNIKFKKIKFKNFDKTKYEYITGENLTFINEKDYVLNEEEKKRKKSFEDCIYNLNERINANLNKLTDIKELIFDNCSNYFIQLILKFVRKNHTLNKDLEYLKLKKCGKEYFDIKGILCLHLKYLILFDIPLKLEELPRNDKLGEIENLSIKISGLEHYCKSNNLDYYKTIKIIVDLIQIENFNKNLCFEMNALPAIMTFLIEKELRAQKVMEEKIVRTYFFFNKPSERQNIKKCFLLNGLKDKNIILKKNYIKSKYTNLEYLCEKKLLDKDGVNKTDYGSDLFNLEEDFNNFFNFNGINNITFYDCLFESTKGIKIYKKEDKNEKEEKIQLKETIINLMEGAKFNVKLDMKTLKEIIYKNQSIDITDILKYITLKTSKVQPSEINDFLKKMEDFCKNLKIIFQIFEKQKKQKITIILNNIKERKEFFYLLNIIKEIKENEMKENSQKKEFKIKSKDQIKTFIIPDFKNNLLESYFLKEKNESNEEISSIFNYYYTSEEENALFGELGKEKVEEISFEIFSVSYTFYIECKYKKKYWNIIYE